MKTIRLVTASLLTLSLGTLLGAADKQIADSQHKWIEVYQKQKNIPLPEAMIGVPIGAAKSVPLCILLNPSIGCFLIPNDEESLAPLMGVFIKAF